MSLPFADSEVPAHMPETHNEFAGVKVNSAPLTGTPFVAPFVPANPEIVEAALDVAAVRPTDEVVDLGCGDGRVIVAALRRSARRGIGVELDPQLAAIARKKIAQAGFGASGGREARGEIVEEDMFDVDIPPTATLVVLYLLPAALQELSPLLARWLSSGAEKDAEGTCNKDGEGKGKEDDRDLASSDATLMDEGVEMEVVRTGKRIVTVGYSIPGWTPAKGVQHRLKSRVDSWIFLYTSESVAK
ncbi:hypothetical protein M427DRAFT_54041 [Gonapodya prolifera JEL478]|uniref:Methyltransferase domain-containing protein n=1 Tax=Gonapodya prolifera (strain JEL478) TaxID=1344416 RepID=A0A139ANZ8_GONPJ|nr:hypothetical protein M427DRAFT_54041 [Gonapodya prolifera JEL478]|eukprot:KXS18215.1 hypothetical protein M427DRAFT_54041 [Gonapodya prolifera JEL478]